MPPLDDLDRELAAFEDSLGPDDRGPVLRRIRRARRVERPPRRAVIAIMAAALLISSVAAAVIVFSQTAPEVPVSTTMTPNCADLVRTPANVVLGSDGNMTFDCGAAGPAFNITGLGFIAATPSLSNFGGNYTSLSVYDADGAITTGACALRSDSEEIVTGVQVTLVSGVGGYNYCAEYVDVGNAGLGSFTVTWSVP